MNTKYISVVLVTVMLVSLCACNNRQMEVKSTTEATISMETVETETTAATEPTETLADIDRDDAVRETEPAVNKGTIIAAEEDMEQDEEKFSSVETIPAEDVGISVEEKTEYEKLMEMSGEEQQAFMESFDSLDAFFAWLEAAKAEYEAKNPGIEISGDGIVVVG